MEESKAQVGQQIASIQECWKREQELVVLLEKDIVLMEEKYQDEFE